MTSIYRKVYRDEVKALGADAAYFLAELRATAAFCEKDGQTDKEGFFEISTEKLEEMTGFDRSKQKRILNILKSLNLIDRKVINNVRLIKLTGIEVVQKCTTKVVQNCTTEVVQKCTTSGAKMTHQVVQKCTTSGAKMTHPNINIDKPMISTVISCSEKTTKNTLKIEALIREYFFEKGYPSEAIKFIKYNLENFGEDHITKDNYKKLADKWIKAKTNPKKKKRRTPGQAKTAREAAEAAGLTVEEFFNRKSSEQADEDTKGMAELMEMIGVGGD